MSDILFVRCKLKDEINIDEAEENTEYDSFFFTTVRIVEQLIFFVALCDKITFFDFCCRVIEKNHTIF